MWCVIRVCQVQIGVWLTQINSIIKIFCAICGARSDVKETLAETAEEIINLNNQINLCETHIPFLRHLRRLRED